jgi:uncharacterized protein (DUF58 family)
MYFFELVRGYVFAIFTLVIIGSLLQDSTLVFAGAMTVTQFYLAVIVLILLVFNLKIGWFVLKNRDVYERNRKATRLLWKARRGKLTPTEAKVFKGYQTQRVLTYNSYGTLRLSDQALQDQFS